MSSSWQGPSSMQWFGEQHPLESCLQLPASRLLQHLELLLQHPKVLCLCLTPMSPRGIPGIWPATDVSLPWEPHDMQQLLHHQLRPKPLSSVMTPAGIPTAASVTPHNNSLGATCITILFTGAAGIATLRTPLETIRFATSFQDWLRRSLLQEWSNSQQALKIIAD